MTVIMRERLRGAAAGRQQWTPLAVLLAFPVVLVLVDTLLPPSSCLGPMMVIAPVLSAVFCRPGNVLLTTVVALGGMLTVAKANLQLYTTSFYIHLATFLLLSATALAAAAVRRRRDKQLVRVRRVARTTQRVLLRPLPRRMNSLAISSMYLASEEEAEIGGDLYAIADCGRTTRILIGDVRGKGLVALDEVNSLLSAFRQAARHGTPLPELAPYLERAFGEDIEQAARADVRDHGDGSASPHFTERFVTALVVDIPKEDSQIRILNCGHSPPLLIQQDQVWTLYPAAPALPLGLGDMGEPVPRVDTVDFSPGDTLLLYTDGLIEARDASGAFYPLTERLRQWTRLTPDELLETIQRDLRRHVQAPLADDVAVVAIQRTPQTADLCVS
jgi:serine phosphatase RsbU (regulator of sigma subunit)